jgi:beta-lactamase class A
VALWIAYTVAAYRALDVQHFIAQYPRIDPARHLIAQEDYVTTLQPLRETLRRMEDTYPEATVSIYVEFLNTGANISINPDTYIWPASLAKIPLALAVMRKIETGKWKLSNELVLMPGDKNSESGDAVNPLDEYPIGSRFTIETLLKEMLVHSDNTAFYILQRNMHDDEIKQVVDDLGLEALFSPEGRVSAKEYSRLFRALYTASFVTREHSELLLEWLDDATFNDFMTHDIPTSVPFPHKYGEKITLNVYADSGIVYIPNRPYLITVMVQGDEHKPYKEERARAASFMRSVSDEAYAYFTQQ